MTDMIEPNFGLPKNNSRKTIKVIGVGGAGSNVVKHIVNRNNEQEALNTTPSDDYLEYIVCNTDEQHLRDLTPDNPNSLIKKILLGKDASKGLGAGSDPAVGEQAAMESLEEIQALIDQDTEIVFIAAGMGGGTGTGAAPVVAKVCRDKNILCIGFIIYPFEDDGEYAHTIAKSGIEQLKKYADIVITIENEKMYDIYPDEPAYLARQKANDVLAIAVQSITRIMSSSYSTNIDIKDVRHSLKDKGTAIIGLGRAEGEDRALKAVKMALESPLLNNNSIEGATNVVLLTLFGQRAYTMTEEKLIKSQIQQEANRNRRTQIISGYNEYPSRELGDDELLVIIIAAGFPDSRQQKMSNAQENKKVFLLDNQPSVAEELSIKTAFTSTSFDIRTRVKPEVKPFEQTPQEVKTPFDFTLTPSHTPWQQEQNEPTISENKTPPKVILSPISKEDSLWEDTASTDTPILEQEQEHTSTEGKRIYHTLSVPQTPNLFSDLSDPLQWEETEEKHSPLNKREDLEPIFILEKKTENAQRIPETESKPLIKIIHKDPVSTPEQTQSLSENDPITLHSLKRTADKRSEIFNQYSHHFGDIKGKSTEQLREFIEQRTSTLHSIDPMAHLQKSHRSGISVGTMGEVQFKDHRSFLHDNNVD